MSIEELIVLIGKDLYDKEVRSLKNGQTKNIFKSEIMDIDIKKVCSKVYIFVNKFGKEDLNSVLNKVCSLT